MKAKEFYDFVLEKESTYTKDLEEYIDSKIYSLVETFNTNAYFFIEGNILRNYTRSIIQRNLKSKYGNIGIELLVDSGTYMNGAIKVSFSINKEVLEKAAKNNIPLKEALTNIVEQQRKIQL